MIRKTTRRLPEIRPPCKYHGAKYYLCTRLNELMPPHNTFVETHGGMGSVTLNKEPAKVEVFNDIYGAVTNLFRGIRDDGRELQRRLTLTPYSELEFGYSNPALILDPIEWARETYVNLRLSIGGRGTSFSYTLHRSRRGMADVVSGYLSAIDEELPKIIGRLRTVQIVCMDGMEVIKKWDSSETFFYVDPPYLQNTRSSKEVYRHEMGDGQKDTPAHILLAELLNQVQGKVMLSGYPSPIYDELFAGWRTVEFDMPNNAAGGEKKARMCEKVWMNY